MPHPARTIVVLLIGFAFVVAGCRTVPGSRLKRKGDEIVVAGQLFHTGTRVVTWMDPGGYDGYRTERRFSPLAESDWEHSKAAVKDLHGPSRYGLRADALSPEEIERVRGGGWDLPTLQRVVDQFVIHYDACGLSKVCFDVLHDRRGLSIHFMLDVDGTVYQTLDLKERALHATIANTRSIGIEIANIGAYPPNDTQPLRDWYRTDAPGKTTLTVPTRIKNPMIRTPHFMGHPARPEPIHGVLQGRELVQYDFTPQQYAALIKLTAALCRIFPQIQCDFPHGADGQPIPGKLANEQLAAFHGVLGHYHVQSDKIDPGPAFDFPKVITGARALLQQ